METKLKTFLRSIPLWAVFVAAGVCLTALFLFIFLARPAPAETPEPTTPPKATAPLNPYTAESFSYDGYWKCLEGESTLGVDVSEWQGDIDWQAVKSAGVDFVMLRIGWRGSEQGILTADTRFESYYDGATAVGLKVGGYFFSQATSREEAMEEALFVLELIDGRSFSMPIAFDWEHIGETARTWGMDGKTLTTCAISFCDVLKRSGYDPMVYFNPDTSLNLLELPSLTQYGFWLAMYDHPMDYPYRVDLWQYTNTGTIPGITGDVDINLYLPYKEELTDVSG